MTYRRYKRSRHWAVYDGAGLLICLCVYKKGAEEVVRRLAALPKPTGSKEAN